MTIFGLEARYRWGVRYDHGAVTAMLFDGYQVFADIWLVGIIPVALYPIYGGKIWCRYWCPLAKWMQMTGKRFGSRQISSNDKCITVCPMDVLSFDNDRRGRVTRRLFGAGTGVRLTIHGVAQASRAIEADRGGTPARSPPE